MFRCSICSRPASYHLTEYEGTPAGNRLAGMWLCDEHGRNMLAELRRVDPSWGVRLTSLGRQPRYSPAPRA